MLHFQSTSSSSALGLLAGLTLVGLCLAAQESPSSNANKEFAKACNEKLAELKTSSQGLTSEEVTKLFEQALDNLAESNNYIGQIISSLKPESIELYDRNGGLFVLTISNKRLEFLAALSETPDDDDAKRMELLETYYAMACGFEKTTEKSLNAMRSSVKIKAATLRGRPIN